MKTPQQKNATFYLWFIVGTFGLIAIAIIYKGHRIDQQDHYDTVKAQADIYRATANDYADSAANFEGNVTFWIGQAKKNDALAKKYADSASKILNP